MNLTVRQIALVAIAAATYLRLTAADGQETELAASALLDLTSKEAVAMIEESKQVWVKFRDGSSITLSVHEKETS